MVASPDAQARVAAAIAAAERTTSGEIFCVVSDRSESYPGTSLAWAAILAFVAPLLLMIAGLEPWRAVPEWRSDDMSAITIVESFAALQLVLFFAGLALIGLTPLERWLTPTRIRRARMHRIATDQFLARGLHDTAARTGVLIFLNLPEHHAEVIADEGIYARVAPEHWGDAVAELTRSARAGDVAGGFERAVALAGQVLAEHFPPGALNPNEVADRLVQM